MKDGEITLNERDQHRVKALADLEGDRMTIADVADDLGVTERCIRLSLGKVMQRLPLAVSAPRCVLR
jgi:hypothetical protein